MDRRDAKNTDKHQGVIEKKKTIDDFHIERIIGEGSYSTVVLAREKTMNQEFAIKVVSKAHIVKNKKIHIIAREKKILSMLSQNPFFVHLMCTFQDEIALYFVLTLVKGGEFLDYLRKLSLEATRFYSKELFSAIYYLHGLDIVHRDIKPENILLSDDLHIKITDFGSSKLLLDNSDNSNVTLKKNTNSLSLQRKISFVGTAQYVSPEMLHNSTTYKSSDIWSIGVIIYQMTTGSFPFRGSNDYYIFKKISALNYNLPEDMDPHVRDLIKSILVADPTARLGCEEMGGFDAIKAHPFFVGTQWEELLKQQAPEEVRAVSHIIRQELICRTHKFRGSELDHLSLDNEIDQFSLDRELDDLSIDEENSQDSED